MKTLPKALSAAEASACEHCNALVYNNTTKCRQCGKFPVKIHHCPRCKCVSAPEAERCWKCGRVFLTGSDYL